MRIVLTIIFAFSIIFSGFSQQKSHGLVHWMTFEEAQKLSEQNPKPILVDIYTSWCGWCKRMVATTYSDPQIAGYINQNFYPIALDAETKDTIIYQGTTYTNPGKTHTLARKLVTRNLSYPSTIFMSPNFQTPSHVPGYLDSKTIAPILVYFKENLLQDANINEFIAYFDSTFTPGHAPVHSGQVNWISMQDALKKNKAKPRKIFVHLSAPDCVSSIVMDSTTYTDPEVAEYLNKNFYSVNFDALSKDTIDILNQKLVNAGYYHQLTMAALKNKVEFPAVLIFNENNELVTPIPQYMTPTFIKAVLRYFKEDIFKQKQFQEYYQEYLKNNP